MDFFEYVEDVLKFTQDCIIFVPSGAYIESIYAINADIYIESGAEVKTVFTTRDVWVEDDVRFDYIDASNVHMGNRNHGRLISTTPPDFEDEKNVSVGNIEIGNRNKISYLTATGDILCGAANSFIEAKSHKGDIVADEYNTFSYIKAGCNVKIGSKNGVLYEIKALGGISVQNGNVISKMYAIDDIHIGETCLIGQCHSYSGNIEAKDFSEVSEIIGHAEVTIGHHCKISNIATEGSVVIGDYDNVDLVFGVVPKKGKQTVVHKVVTDYPL